ncbi:MAG: trypsin-like peptidase domain-containing protein [Anaerolineaceae bacterium]
MQKNKLKILILLVVVVMVGSACSLTNLSSRLDTQTQTEETAVVQDTVPTALPPSNSTTIMVPEYGDLGDTLETLYQQVSPGVVSIQFTTTQGDGLGSGFVIDKEGHIVTNYHVVEEADKLEVHFASGTKVYGEVIGTDLDSDLAVIKVDVDPDELTPLTLGDSDTAVVGQTVAAIGNPYGLSGTMTMGIISARGRVLDSIRQTASGMYFSAADLIQTDTSINPGNSGGPLLNLNGEVIGVNRAIQTSGTTTTGEAVNTGIGFAITSNIVRRVLPSLIENGSYDYPYLGLSSMNSLSLAMQEALDLPQSTGAYVSDVVTGGPAEKAGIHAGTRQTEISELYSGGDLIIAADGQPVKEFGDLLSYMVLNKVPGDVITFTVIRDGKQLDVPVTLDKRP